MDIIDQEIEDHRKAIEKLEALRPLVVQLKDAASLFPGLGASVRIAVEQPIIDVFPAGSLGDVAPLLGHLSNCGFRRISEWNMEDLDMRCYSYRGFRIDVCFNKSSSCSFVQTGTKKVPVYELQCDEQDIEATADVGAEVKA